MILITHQMDEAAKADRVVVLHKGIVHMDGTPEEVFSQIEKLHSIGLRAPDSAELIWALNREGFHLDNRCIEEDECVQALCNALKNKA